MSDPLVDFAAARARELRTKIAELDQFLVVASRLVEEGVAKPALHFVGFRGDEYTSAIRVWGKPSFIHMGNDARMRREVAEGDTIVYANGWESRRSERNFSDTTERLP